MPALEYVMAMGKDN